MTRKEPVWIMVLRILLAVVFLFSGFSKAIDPVSFSYTISGMLTSFGMEFLLPLSMLCAFVMIVVEFVLGIMMLFKIKIVLTSIGYLLFMGFFFVLTAWLAVAEHLEIHYGYDFGVVKDCGCFGNVLKPNNLETFLKNVVIMIPTLIIFFKRKSIPDIRLSTIKQWAIVGVGALCVFAFEFYCYAHFPVIDFSDWKKDKDLVPMLITQPAEKEMTFIYQNTEDNSLMTITVDELADITDAIPDFYDVYEYVDRKDSIITPAVMPQIHGFSMLDASGADHAFKLINYQNEKTLYLLFMHDLFEVDFKGLHNDKLRAIIEKTEKEGAVFAAITNSSQGDIDIFIEKNGITFPIYSDPTDPIKGPFTVRDAIHSNPGLIIIKQGIVVDKYAWRDFPK